MESGIVIITGVATPFPNSLPRYFEVIDTWIIGRISNDKQNKIKLSSKLIAIIVASPTASPITANKIR